MPSRPPRLYHDQTPEFLTVQPAGQSVPSYGHDLTVRVKLETPAGCLKAAVVTYPDADERHDALTLESSSGGLDTWTGTFTWRSGDPCRYRFKAVMPDSAGGKTYPLWFRGEVEPQGGSRVWWLNAAGVTPFTPPRDTDFAFSPDEPPAWVTSAVFYQIFPDRFRNGDPSTDVKDGEHAYGGRPVFARAWGERPQPQTGGLEFYGGDLPGIRSRLDYLQDLGVTALYLNPIFTAPSVHRYDTQDYRTVDPHLGGNAAFHDLAADLHRLGMRVLLDGVFNHAGVTHAWFRAASGAETAPERAYFTFPEGGNDYATWLGVKTLPKLDYRSPELADAVYAGEDSIVRHWLKPTAPGRDDAADGWRLDVVHMMGEGGTSRGNHRVLAGLRAAMRDARPDSYLIGEHFYDATEWLQGNLEDGAMNYPGFTWPTWGFLAGTDHRGEPMALDAAEYDAAMRAARARLPWRNQLAQFNLLDSHDTPRLISLLPRRELARVAAVLLFTAVGVPCVYYGDEIGLEGGQDPDCRRTMPWDEAAWDAGLRDHDRRLIGLRRASRALQEGGWET
ncbi:MAG TPA: maltodextrin glucosidase, partial [Deinococcales bacterium]|nr:maltodextrin glucosidase [Deinococcales bacterium]